MDAVKRPYAAPVRVEQAMRTRGRVLDAAAEAFTARGWSGTTLSAVAAAAGVTPQAVHLSVGAKPALLIATVERAVAGDQPDVALVEREPFRRAYAPGGSVVERASAFAAGTSEVYQRAGPLFLVLAQAAPLDAELARRWDRARARRLEDCKRLLELAARPAVRDGRADLLFVMSGPGVHADLVGDRGWSSAAYEAWLTTTVEGLLTS